MKEKTVSELKEMLDAKEAFQLIDVREPYEFEAANLGGELIPLSTVLEHASRLSTTLPVIIYCRSGARSAAAVNQLEKTHHFTNLYNLKGGILAWAREIDQTLSI